MLELDSGLSSKQKELLGRIIKLSADSSGVAISEMTGKAIFMQSPKIDIIPLGAVPSITGGVEATAVSVCLLLTGDIGGNILLVFPGKSAFKLVDLIMQEDGGDRDELDDMATSVLGEVGNLVSAYFVSTLSDYTGLDIRPSSPMVAKDMVGALVSSAMVILQKAPDEILYIETNIADESSKIDGYLMLFTDENSLQTILQKVEAR